MVKKNQPYLIMITLLSPAKSLDYTTNPTLLEHSIPAFLDDSQILINQLKELALQDIANLMKVSDSIAALNLNRFHEWDKQEIKTFNALSLNEFSKTKQAILAFNGDVYRGLNAQTLTLAQLFYSQRHIAILSGLYGLLRPLDLIQAYRLEMGTSLKNTKGKNLYDFWGDKVTKKLIHHLHSDLDEFNTPPVVVNCASAEYFKVIHTNLLDAQGIPVYTPVFLNQDKSGRYKTISIYAKVARGEFARFTLEEKIRNPKDLSAFSDWNNSGYVLDKVETGNMLIFKA